MKKPNFDDLRKHAHKETFGPKPDDDKVRHLHKPGFKIDVRDASQVTAPTGGDYLVKGMIEPGSTSIWFANPGVGKTFLLLHMAYNIARGTPVYDRRVRKANTLYCALEGRGGIERRIFALVQSMGREAGFKYTGTPLQLLTSDRGRTKQNEEHVTALKLCILDNNIKFVILDTLNLTIGGADENDNSAMGELIRAAGDIASVTGAHFAFVAHASKSDPTKGPRGASAQMGNADVVVAIAGEGKHLSFSTFASDGGKIKDGAPFKYHAELDEVELATDDDGDAITSCILRETEAPAVETPKGRLTPELKQAYIEICDLFSTPGAAVPARPHRDMSTLPCVTPRQINDHWAKTGRLDRDGTKPDSFRKSGQRLRNKLRDMGKIAMTDEYVWLVSGLDT